MKATMTLAVTGLVGPYTVIADDALEILLDRIQASPSPTVTIELGGERGRAPILRETARIEELPGDRRALRAEVELPDGFSTPEPVRGLALTEADRAEQMRRLEAGQ